MIANLTQGEEDLPLTMLSRKLKTSTQTQLLTVDKMIVDGCLLRKC